MFFSRKNRDTLNEIAQLGHEIGLHFDEENYKNKDINIEELIYQEADILTNILDKPVKSVSMHRPSKKTLEANYQFNNIINAYGKNFFSEFKYVSDSRMNWREDVLSIIKEKEYDKIHILTHPFWYGNKSCDIKFILKEFCENAIYDRYSSLANNITSIESILKREELLGEKSFEF